MTQQKSAHAWQPDFIAALRRTGNVRAACKAAGISRTAAYNARNAFADFKALWDEALEDACDDLEGEARRRAFKGVKKPVYQQGALVGYVQEYSDTLLIFLLKAHRPEKFRERYEHQHSGTVVLVTADDMAQARQAAQEFERERFGADI